MILTATRATRCYRSLSRPSGAVDTNAARSGAYAANTNRTQPPRGYAVGIARFDPRRTFLRQRPIPLRLFSPRGSA